MELTMPEIRRSLVRASHELHHRGWVANHDGNISLRLPGNRILITPTALSKGDVQEVDLVEVDLNGRKLNGARKPPSELALHLCIYKHRPDLRAVIHAHPPSSVAHSIVGMEIPTTMMAEPIVSIGDSIPLIPFAPPGSADLSSYLQSAFSEASCILMENHGPIVGGFDLEMARLRLELVEHLAKIHERVQKLGVPRHLPRPVIAELVAKHRKAGLAPPKR